MKCRESAGMVDKWVIGAQSLVVEVINNDDNNLIQRSTVDQRGLFENPDNTSLANAYDKADNQPKRLKLCRTTLGINKVII